MDQWVAIHDETPTIADYALLGNCQGSALVSRAGCIDWACLPSFDAPAFFARILGEPGGFWTIRPHGPSESTRAYVEDTMVLQTRFRCAAGAVVLTDFMPLHRDDRYNDIGRRAPSAICRMLECTEGTVELAVEIAIRPEFGLTTPLVRSTSPGMWRTRGGPLAVAIATDASLEIDGALLRADITLTAGQQVSFALQTGDPWGDPPPAIAPLEVRAVRDATIAGWQSWAEKLVGYEGGYREPLRRSAVVLRALNYAPTGAIVAAPTTSLPEEIGGVRNWDYRYTWVRDASFTIGALAASGCGFEASKFFEFFANASAGSLASGQGLQIMYGVRGERFIPEHELPMTGHRGSRPVRIGNGAWDQTQLDVYGELLDAAWQISELGIEVDAELGEFLANVADRAVLRWNDIDEGIWEVRGGAGHFLYSKVMNWVALDRAVLLASRLDVAPERVARWTEERDRIRDAILTQGWDDDVGAYTQAFGRPDLDASVLMMPIVGFLPADDPRMRATIDAIASRLTDDRGFVYRYLTEDGLPGGEGTFGICTFWLAECLARAGEVDRARALFDLMAGCANDVGLLAEEIDPATGELLGNFPQAFTHIGLIHSALAIEDALDASPATRQDAREMSRSTRARRSELRILLRMAGGLAEGVIVRPRFRGRLHQGAFLLAVPAGVLLVLSSRGVTAHVAATLFALSLLALFGASGTYHMARWAPAVKARLQRLDHAMIFVLIAGSYTPITLLALDPAWGITFLVLAWLIAVGGAILALWHIDTVHRYAAYLYIGFGWLLMLALPAVLQALNTTELLLLVAGGLLYTIGAIGLWLKRPDPSPTFFGYHEVWHAMTLAAATCHYTLVLMLVRG